MKIPFVPRELVLHLDRVYPARHPDLSAPERKVWFDAGQRSVVENLQQWLKEQDLTGGADEGRLPNVLTQPVSSGGSSSGDSYPSPASATAARTPGSTGNRLGRDA